MLLIYFKHATVCSLNISAFNPTSLDLNLLSVLSLGYTLTLISVDDIVWNCCLKENNKINKFKIIN